MAPDGASKLTPTAKPPAQVSAQNVDFNTVSPKNAGAYGGEGGPNCGRPVGVL